MVVPDFDCSCCLGVYVNLVIVGVLWVCVSGWFWDFLRCLSGWWFCIGVVGLSCVSWVSCRLTWCRFLTAGVCGCISIAGVVCG